MYTTTIVNCTDYDLTVMEGNAGLYSRVGHISAGKSFKCNTDPNATYREYAFECSGQKLIVSSIDMADSGVITITWEEEKLMMKTTTRDDSKSLSISSLSSWLSRFLEFFGLRN